MRSLNIRHVEFDRHVPAFDVAGFFKAPTERIRYAPVRSGEAGC